MSQDIFIQTQRKTSESRAEIDAVTMSTNMAIFSGALRILLSVFYLTHVTHQHGRMIEPPARNSMWRIGYNTTRNYEDSELFCGGIANQWHTNKGKCGLCGDSYSIKPPRPYESGGKRVKDITTRVYPPGAVIDVVIQIVANHMGTFEFGLCPRNNTDQVETEECFIPLNVNGSQKYRIKTNRKGNFNIPVQLPKDVTCEMCVLRWHWKSANNWGTCENRIQAVGCGPQETYRNCADIVIRHEKGIRGPGELNWPSSTEGVEDDGHCEHCLRMPHDEDEPMMSAGDRSIHDDHITFHQFQ